MELRGTLKQAGESLRRLHWIRGLRAGLAVAVSMIVCHVFRSSIGWAAGWAALGGFEAILVDNGGPYRSRFATMTTLMVGGTLACLAGAAATGSSALLSVLGAVAITAAFCFAVTFARVAAQPVASSSVIILVIYFVALGSSAHSLREALWHALAFVLGAVWAAALSLVLWPIDPFRPPRLAIARCYELLAEFNSGLQPAQHGGEERHAARKRAFEWQRRMRLQIEVARTALVATTARAPSRTVRARNLAVLLETVDMLFAAGIRMTELSLGLPVESVALDPASSSDFGRWLSEAERSIARGLQHQPRRGTEICSDRFEVAEPPRGDHAQRSALVHLVAAQADAMQNIEIACEAVKAVGSGIETRSAANATALAGASVATGNAVAGFDAVRANWTLNSVMMRHALRVTVVGVVDVLLLRFLHISHGYWLGMTSIIVLQPYHANTLRRGLQRVGGTVAGGILAAVLAVLIASQVGIIAVVTATSVLTLATYAVDYAWYCFFLTPTFVLLSLPHVRDWQYSGVRMLTTMLGAAVAVAAMRLLWPEREHLALGGLLARAAAADAAYLRATLQSCAMAERGVQSSRDVERQVIAPARRACGLAANDIEESLDRLMLEPGLGRLVAGASSAAPMKEHALTFVTYLRRLTQSVTTLAGLGNNHRATIAKLEDLAARLELVSSALAGNILKLPAPVDDFGTSDIATDIAAYLLQRMERQVSILERTAAGLIGVSSS
jgi:uncharacterized membrane protein YccC